MSKNEQPPIPKKKGRGRKGKFNQRIIDLILQALDKGATHKIAIQAAGITAPTFYRWMARGEKGEKEYKSFFESVRTSEAQGALRHLENIQKHSINDWKASAWLLERKWKYTKESKLEESTNSNTEIKSMGTAREILEEQYTQLSQAAADALRTGSFQAFAALKRQEYNLALDLKKEEEKDSTGLFGDMEDDQIIAEIEGLLISLPPVIKQRIEGSIISRKLKL